MVNCDLIHYMVDSFIGWC